MKQIIIKMTNLTTNDAPSCLEIENYLSEWELEMMLSPDDATFWELFSDGSASPTPSEPTPVAASPSPSSEEEDEQMKDILLPFASELDVNSTFASTLYRRDAIKRWQEKRSRRCFRKKIVCKARKDYADTRQRKGGRFTKSTAPGWVSITEVNNGL
jgi:hypothetical protein